MQSYFQDFLPSLHICSHPVLAFTSKSNPSKKPAGARPPVYCPARSLPAKNSNEATCWVSSNEGMLSARCSPRSPANLRSPGAWPSEIAGHPPGRRLRKRCARRTAAKGWRWRRSSNLRSSLRPPLPFLRCLRLRIKASREGGEEGAG